MRFFDWLKRKPTSQDYIPEIDGLRFIAIIWVVFHHFFLLYGHAFQVTSEQLSEPIVAIGEGGYKGVQLFFVLSGFILAIPFISQPQSGEKKRFSLAGYYLRRFVRIEMPYIIAMSLCLLVILRTGALNSEQLTPHFLATLTYTHNIIYATKSWISGVAWSLEIEIQFYLLSPLIFQVFKLGAISRRTLLVVSTLLLLIAHCFYYPRTETIYQYLPYFVAGILLADWHLNGYPGFIRNPWFAIAGLVAGVLIFYIPVEDQHSLDILLLLSIVCFYSAVLTHRTFKRIMSLPTLTITGAMCYSIYLIHVPIQVYCIYYLKKMGTLSSVSLDMMFKFGISSLVVLLFGGLFYAAIEKPFISLSRVFRTSKRVPDDDIAADRETA
jgi:peptidoglycan/LPS O-acetylase OafA/YrhL